MKKEPGQGGERGGGGQKCWNGSGAHRVFMPRLSSTDLSTPFAAKARYAGKINSKRGKRVESRRGLKNLLNLSNLLEQN